MLSQRRVPTGRSDSADRAFTITGAGTVLTGTLPAGTLTAGDRLELLGGTRTREVTVRGLQTHGRDCDVAGPVSRVAVNVRGVSAVDVHRGDALVTPGTVVRVSLIDVRRTSGGGSVPELLTVHAGSAAVPARSRSFDDDHHRLTLASPLPLHVGDQLVLRDPRAGRIVGGAQVLDLDPPPPAPPRGRRAAKTRIWPFATMTRPWVRKWRAACRRAQPVGGSGFAVEALPDGVEGGRPLVGVASTTRRLAGRLRGAVVALHERDPLTAGLSDRAARDLLALPDVGRCCPR